MSMPKRFKKVYSAMKIPSRMPLNLLIDESQCQIDEMIVRTIISCVEINAKTTTDELEKQVKSLVDELIPVFNKKKVHLADFTQDEKCAVINAISKLEFTTKIWVHYGVHKNQTEAKKDAMRNTIISLQKKHSKNNVNFLIEHATDYRQVIKGKFMTRSSYLSLLPDICCYIMKLKLDKQKIIKSIPDDKVRDKKSQELDRLISSMHEHIRLQVVDIKEDCIELNRENRI